MGYRRLFYLTCDHTYVCLATSAELPGHAAAVTKGDAETVAYHHGWTEFTDDLGLTRHLCPAHSTDTEGAAA